MSKERRKFRRYLFSDSENYRCSFTIDGIDYEDMRIVSLSAGGMFVALNQSQARTITKRVEVLDIQFAIKSYGFMVPKGRVAHAFPLANAQGCGVEFIDLPVQHADSLSRLLAVTMSEAR